MDDKTIQYMKKRVDEAERLKRAMYDNRHTRAEVDRNDVLLAKPNGYGHLYSVYPLLPQAAKDIVLAEIDAAHAELQKQLDVL